MNEQELLQAFSRVDRGFVEEAEQPVAKKSPVLLRVTASLAAVAAACAGILFGMRWLGRQQGITYSPGYSDNLIESAVSDTQTDSTSADTTRTTAGTTRTQTGQAVTTQTTVSAAEGTTGQTTNTTTKQTTHTTEKQTNSSGSTTKDTKLPWVITNTTAPNEQTEPVTSREQTPMQADPEAVIQQLRTGYLHGFNWDAQRVYASNKVVPHQVCEIDYVPYGVAFLCRDSDLEALKTGSIGQYPVNWSEGAWTDAGGSGIGYVNGASADNCLVQPVSGFVYQYGGDNATEMSGTGHSFSFRYDQQTQCRVMNDFSEFARDGWTVCMASVQAPICCTPGGAVYRDYTELIRALAEKPETVLLDIVYGEECSFGLPEPIIDEIYEFYVHIPDGAAVPEALSAYGTVDEMSGIPGDSYWLLETHNDFSSAYGWYGLELSAAFSQPGEQRRLAAALRGARSDPGRPPCTARNGILCLNEK